MGRVFSVTDADFAEDVLQCKLPVVVDFWAEWCGPCKMLTPILEDVARELKGKAKFYKMNIDENSITPPEYSVRGIPTLLLFSNGSLQATHVGLLSKDEAISFVQKHIEK